MTSYQEPEFLPWDGKRVPITFVAGYLGAGKTTVINTLLATADRPIAVLVNDVGKVNIDARLIRSRHGDTIELTDGCVCCSLSDGFGAAFDQLRARETPPDHVVVELSGVAEPSRVIPWGRSAGFKLDGVITLVDADQFDNRMADPITELTITNQIVAADVVVLTKLDLVSQEQRMHVVSKINAFAAGVPIVDATSAEDTAALLQLGGRRPNGIDDLPQPSLFDPHVTALIPLADPIERDAIDVVLAALDVNVVRAKGVARDRGGNHWLIQVVGKRRSVTALPEAELQQPTDLVTISIRR